MMSVTHPPGAQVADHVVRVGDEDVRVGDRGDAVDHVEAAGHEQQDGREQDPGCSRGRPRAARPCCRQAARLPMSFCASHAIRPRLSPGPSGACA